MVKPTWRIEEFPSYFIGDDKQLYLCFKIFFAPFTSKYCRCFRAK